MESFGENSTWQKQPRKETLKNIGAQGEALIFYWLGRKGKGAAFEVSWTEDGTPQLTS